MCARMCLCACVCFEKGGWTLEPGRTSAFACAFVSVCVCCVCVCVCVCLCVCVCCVCVLRNEDGHRNQGARGTGAAHQSLPAPAHHAARAARAWLVAGERPRGPARRRGGPTHGCACSARTGPPLTAAAAGVGAAMAMGERAAVVWPCRSCTGLWRSNGRRLQQWSLPARDGHARNTVLRSWRARTGARCGLYTGAPEVWPHAEWEVTARRAHHHWTVHVSGAHAA